MEILYSDPDLIVCVKPPRVLSTDEPGGLPDLVRQALGDPNADVRTVHRLDRVVSGLMVLARNRAAASFLSRQIREDRFGKTYLAVVHGIPGEEAAVLRCAVRFRTRLEALLGPEAARFTLLGPAPCPVPKINYHYRYRLMLHGSFDRPMRRLTAHLLRQFSLDKANRGVSAFVDVNGSND